MQISVNKRLIPPAMMKYQKYWYGTSEKYLRINKDYKHIDQPGVSKRITLMIKWISQ